MEFKGEHRIDAPRDVVWAAINDPVVLRACIPGCEELQGSPHDGFTADIVLKVGPIKARFSGSVRISDVNAPCGYRLSGQGNGGVAGFAKGFANVTLSSEDRQTLLTYNCEVQIGGKLAQLGSRMVASSVAKMADVFFKNLAQEIDHRN